MINYSWNFKEEDFSLELNFFNEKEQEDVLWQAKTELNYETVCGAIESIIFMSDRPVSLHKIKAQIDSDLPLRVIHSSIKRLQDEYELKHHGIRLMEVAEGYQFRTKASFSHLITKMFKVSSTQLTPTALEVLALITYKQPVSKTKIESVRGVDSSHIVRQLIDKRLVKIVGKSEDELGRPALYGTTAEFLEVFNLNSIDELPSESELAELAQANDIGDIHQIKSIVNPDNKKSFIYDEFEELENLSREIASIVPETVFTSRLKAEEKHPSVEGVKKSAFDILEDLVNEKEIAEQNEKAQQSEIVAQELEAQMQTVALPTESLTHGLKPDLEEMDFDAELEENVEAALEASLKILNDNDIDESDQIEEESLANALDAAFDNLMEDVPVAPEENTEGEENLLQEAKKYNIDLSSWD